MNEWNMLMELLGDKYEVEVAYTEEGDVDFIEVIYENMIIAHIDGEDIDNYYSLAMDILAEEYGEDFIPNDEAVNAIKDKLNKLGYDVNIVFDHMYHDIDVHYGEMCLEPIVIPHTMEEVNKTVAEIVNQIKKSENLSNEEAKEVMLSMFQAKGYNPYIDIEGCGDDGFMLMDGFALSLNGLCYWNDEMPQTVKECEEIVNEIIEDQIIKEKEVKEKVETVETKETTTEEEVIEETVEEVAKEEETEEEVEVEELSLYEKSVMKLNILPREVLQSIARKYGVEATGEEITNAIIIEEAEGADDEALVALTEKWGIGLEIKDAENIEDREETPAVKEVKETEEAPAENQTTENPAVEEEAPEDGLDYVRKALGEGFAVAPYVYYKKGGIPTMDGVVVYDEMSDIIMAFKTRELQAIIDGVLEKIA